MIKSFPAFEPTPDREPVGFIGGRARICSRAPRPATRGADAAGPGSRRSRTIDEHEMPETEPTPSSAAARATA